MPLVQISESDGSWNRLKAAWKEQCEAAGDDFSLYAQGTFIVLDDLAKKAEARAGIYGVKRGDEPPEVICQVNTTPLPGHPEPVMRIRMVTVSPAIDFGLVPEASYAETLADLFFGIIELTQDDNMGANEFKMHLRSPEDFRSWLSAAARTRKLSEPSASACQDSRRSCARALAI